MSPAAAGFHIEAQAHARAIPYCATRSGKRSLVRSFVAAIKAALRADGWR